MGGLTETLVKVVFWSRIRKAKRIGEAATLIGEGRAEECLEILGKMEKRIPPYVGYLFFLTRGRALDELRRDEEAEQSYLAAVFAKEGASQAHLHLAVLCGRLRRFEESRRWIERIREDDEAEEEILEQAQEIEQMLEDVEGGARLEEIRRRGSAFAAARGVEERSPSQALSSVDDWIEENQDRACTDCDEIACWLGELAARSGSWSLSLNLEDSVVIFESGDEFRPFEVVAARFSEGLLLTESFHVGR